VGGITSIAVSYGFAFYITGFAGGLQIFSTPVQSGFPSNTAFGALQFSVNIAQVVSFTSTPEIISAGIHNGNLQQTFNGTISFIRLY
jgi:hypothetical protein